MSAQSVASVPPAPALIERTAFFASYSPLNRSSVRSRSNSVARAAASRSRSASVSASGDSARSSASSVMSFARFSIARQRATSSRRPSASRVTFCASRWSSQNPGSMARASSSATRIFLGG